MGCRRPARRSASPAASPPSGGRSRSSTSITPTSTTRSCARRASSPCSSSRCSSQGRVIGVLHVGSHTPREFSDDDATSCSSPPTRRARDRAGAALMRSRAREAAELITRQLRGIQKVTDATLGLPPEEELLQELLAAGRRDPCGRHGGDPAAQRHRLHARAAKGIEEEVEQGVQIPLGRGFAGRIAAEKRAITIYDVDHADILNPILRERASNPCSAYPLLVQGRVIGVLHVGSPPARVQQRRARPPAAGRRPRRARHRAGAPVRAAARGGRWSSSGAPPGDLDRSGLEGAARYLPAALARLGGDWNYVFPLVAGAGGCGRQSRGCRRDGAAAHGPRRGLCGGGGRAGATWPTASTT